MPLRGWLLNDVRGVEAQETLLVDDGVDECYLTERVFNKFEGIATLNLVGSGNEAIAYMIGEGKFAGRGQFPFPSLIVTDLNIRNGDGSLYCAPLLPVFDCEIRKSRTNQFGEARQI